MTSVLWGRSLGAALARAALVGAALFLVSRTILIPVRAQGISMLPTRTEGELLLVNALAYRFGDPQRGDIVAVRLAGGRAFLVKRVIGLPGERITIARGVVLVNGAPLDEPYVVLRSPWDVGETLLEPDEYYVVGDNRSMPARSHDFGRASRDRIAGKVVF
jgi:signal peptidase I